MTTPPNSMDQLKLLSQMIDCMGEVIDPNMPWHQGQVFLAIALAHPESIEMRDLGKLTGLSTSAISRNVAALGEWHRLQRPGLGLVETRIDLSDRRRRPIHLSKKGITAANKLKEAMTEKLTAVLGKDKE